MIITLTFKSSTKIVGQASHHSITHTHRYIKTEKKRYQIQGEGTPITGKLKKKERKYINKIK
jgi:hypothetical protein